MKKRSIILLFILVLFLLGTVVGINYYSQKKEQAQQKAREEEYIKKKKRNEIHFKNTDLNDTVNNKKISSDLAKSNLESAITYAVSLIGPTKAIRNQDLTSSKLTDEQNKKVNEYFKTFDAFNSFIANINHSSNDNNANVQKNVKVDNPTPGTNYTIKSLDLEYLKSDKDNDNFTYNVKMSYQAGQIASYEVNMTAEVDSFTGKVVSIQSVLNG